MKGLVMTSGAVTHQGTTLYGTRLLRYHRRALRQNSSRAMTDFHARPEVLRCKGRQRGWLRIYEKLFGVILEESVAGRYEIQNRTEIAERRSERDRSKTTNPGSGSEIASFLGT